MQPSDQLIVSSREAIGGVELRERSLRAASGFASMGLRQGDSVAVMMRNDIAYLEVILALGQLGVYLVAVNWHFRPEESGFILRDSGARALVIDADLLEQVPPLDVPVLVVDSGAPAPPGQHVYAVWRDQFAPYDGPPGPALGSMLYTSGTTGRPKAVMRLPGTPRQHAGAMRVRSMASQARERMRTVVVAPLYHAGPNAAARVALEQAERIVMMDRFDAEGLLRAIEAHRVTHLSLVPVMLVRLLKLPPELRNRYDVSSLESVTHGGSSCAPEVKQAIIDWWGPIVSETYGSTEAGLVTFVNAVEWLQRPGTAGRPFPGTSIRILGSNDTWAGPGEVGEIYVDPGENALPFTYRNAPEQRRDIERDGYFTNGDVGYLDQDGYLFVTDRKRDMVISGGVNIYPAEVEHVLTTHPDVMDCAVFGVPDEEYGEALAAAVVPAPGANPSAEDLRAWLRDRMAGYKVPRRYEFHVALPRDAMGKVFKNKLRATHWQTQQPGS